MQHRGRLEGHAELEAARTLSALLGFPIRRKLGAGRADDVGDLDPRDRPDLLDHPSVEHSQCKMRGRPFSR